MYGIEKLIKALTALINITNSVGKAFQDGKISIWEGANILRQLIAFRFIIKDWQQLKKEYYDLTNEEKTEILMLISQKVQIHNERVKEIIENGFILLTRIWSLFQKNK